MQNKCKYHRKGVYYLIMSKITYENKEQLNTNENIPAKNKCMASDLNEIKEVVNENDTNALYNTNVKTIKTDSDTDVYGCNYINKLTNKNIMQLIVSNEYNLTTNNEYENVKFDTKQFSIGNKLTFDSTNNAIKIGEGVSKVKIHAELSIVKASDGLIYLRLETSTGKVAGCNIRIATGFRGKASCDVYMNVSKNELIQLKTYGSTSDIVTGGDGFTSLIVEVIE